MENQTFDTIAQDSEIFDKLLNWICKLKQDGIYPLGLEEQILKIERILQDIEDDTISNLIKDRLNYWLFIVLYFKNDPRLLKGIQYTLISLIAILLYTIIDGVRRVSIARLQPVYPFKEGKINLKSDYTKITKLLNKNGLGFYQKKMEGNINTFMREIELFLIYSKSEKNLFYPLVIHEDHSKSAKIILNKLSTSDLNLIDYAFEPKNFFVKSLQSLNFTPGYESPKKVVIEQAKYIWEIKLTFYDGLYSSSQIGYLIWTLGEALESISGVATIVENWGQGSLWVKIKVYIKDFFAKEGVKETLGKVKEGLIDQYLEKPIHEVAKLEAERNKIEAETSALNKQTESSPNLSEAKELLQLEFERRKLEIEDKERDIERKDIENKMLKLEYIRKASNLVKEGIIKADPVGIEVNDLLLLVFKNGEVSLGESIEEIEKNETKGPKSNLN